MLRFLPPLFTIDTTSVTNSEFDVATRSLLVGDATDSLIGDSA